MVPLLLLLSALPSAFAAPASPASAAAPYVGSTQSAVFPPPGATITEYASLFPNASVVGFLGPTPTGAEAQAIATAPVAALRYDTYPLVAPANQYTTSGPAFDLMHHWGNLGPAYSVGGAFGLPNTSPQVPAGCELEQVHLLFRHGARYPTSGSQPSEFAALLHSAATERNSRLSFSGPLEFLSTWTYKLGAEILTPFGRKQCLDLGVAFRVKYGELLNGFTELPVFRTTSEDRMQKTLLNFAVGFFGAPEYLTAYHEEIIIESGGYNNTLAPSNACPDSGNAVGGNIGGWTSGNWTEIYLKETTARLQQYVTGVQLTPSVVYGMQQMCAYETVALGYSSFCELFTEEEWRGFEYSIDLSFWYGNGPGNPTAAAMGIGYVQELVARLTKTLPTKFDTNMNGTLDSSTITFPLDQPIYADATHDTVIASIITALNFTTLAANGPLPIDHIPVYQTYHVNEIAPFSSNLVAQVLSCPASAAAYDSKTESYIRFLLNDGAVPLTGIAHCETPNEDGLCLFDNFVKGMQERIAEVNYAYDCYASYSAPTPDNIIDGQV